MFKKLAIALILTCLGASLAAGSGPYILIKSLNNCQGSEYSEIGSAKPTQGNTFLVVGLQIENHGYEGFSVDPSSFSLTINNFDYKNAPATYYLDQVGKKILPSGNLKNGGNINGYIAFEVPSGSKGYKVAYTGWEKVTVEYKCG